MVKIVIGVVLILAAAGGWLYLDQLNKAELAAAAEMRKIVEQNRALAIAAEKARVEAKIQFENKINTELKACNDAADTANKEFLAQHQKPVPRKPNQFTILEADTAEAAKLLEAANAACLSTHDKRLAAGN